MTHLFPDFHIFLGDECSFKTGTPVLWIALKFTL